ncbi:MAG: 4'-phosphopantetheinyl transferase superfamily protein [Desulfobacteraceae bacterium]|nr:4'-phosphopantetheinyl transferase superfamily protein [Desulfobacteraceae bacterium]
MNLSTTNFIENKVKSILISNESEINLWYCEIPLILKILFCEEKYFGFINDDIMVKNQVFKKSDFLESFLSDLELNTLNKFKSLKKQIEWMSGRFLLKNCLLSTFSHIGELKNILIAYEEEGAPFLPDFPEIKISLSHSGDYAAVGICAKTDIDIGIDLEHLNKKPDNNFLKTAFTQNEISNMDDTIEDILTKWTVKEAFLKYIRKGFNESLHRVEVIEDRVLYNKKDSRVKTITKKIDKNYVISLVTGKAIGS